MTHCTECGSTELTEFDDFIECTDCGSQFELESEDDDVIPYEGDVVDEYDW